jgi:valine--pyruvate aminotransferase
MPEKLGHVPSHQGSIYSPDMKLSNLGARFTNNTGILQLMDDLGNALSGPERKYMLGGGNPALIPEIAVVWRSQMRQLLENPDEFDRVIGQYDTPQGRPRFISALTAMLNREFGWGIDTDNVAVTNGSQSAFFMALNILSGPGMSGVNRIVFPLTPEYIGYADQTIDPDAFVSFRPRIEQLDEHTHKYHIDFESLRIPEDAAAICVSRPTNPSGNVLTNDEIARLDALAKDHDILLIVDNAYGTPFPDIIFVDAKPTWNENTILTMSLSKIGLPSARTGIVIASKQVVRAVTAMNAVLSLANGTIGQALTESLFESGEILRLSREIVKPFYRRKAEHAKQCIRRRFGEGERARFPYSVHRCEGALFLWIWFCDLPGTTMQLYERLKSRDVIVVPGAYFFFGRDESWEHRDRCIRVNYAMADQDVDHGIEVIAEEVETMWRNS